MWQWGVLVKLAATFFPQPPSPTIPKFTLSLVMREILACRLRGGALDVERRSIKSRGA
jgi:hypothetical protein